MSAVRILVADDFAEWRTRIRSILQERPEWKVVGEACDGLQAIRMTTEPPNACSSLDSIQDWHSNIQKNNVGTQPI